MEEEYLTHCMINMHGKSFHLFSNTGTEKVIECQTVAQFMEVLKVVKENLSEDMTIYSIDMEF